MALNMQGSKTNPFGGINWTHVFGPQTGATINFTAGCFHDCQWVVDGKVVICYAKGTVDRRRAQMQPGEGAFYPDGFESHYWNPQRLIEPVQYTRKRLGIFADSMGDLFGHWVRDEEIRAVLEAMALAPWHIFFTLTKNPGRMANFASDMPFNLWAGFSMPPDFMWGNSMHPERKRRYFQRGISTLRWIRNNTDFQGKVWISYEPLSHDVTEWYDSAERPEQLAVIGAATDGSRVIQPLPEHVLALEAALDTQGIPVHYKDNLEGNPALTRWRTEYPEIPEVGLPA
jgi:hypothetical protein